MNNYHLYLLLLVIALTFYACDDNFSSTQITHSVDVRLDLPEDIDVDNLKDAAISFRNLSSGESTEFSYPMPDNARILSGLYDIEFSASTISSAGNLTAIKAVGRSIRILSDGSMIRLKAYCNIESDDLIISEIFFSGTLQNSGNQYYGDDYIKLYNNTDHIVYADGLTLFETKFLTTQKLDFNPDIMSEAVTVHALYIIPGTGKEHPVNPGEYVLLADVGIDHRTVNPNSFSLEHADWEWYDVSTKPNNLDIDSQCVPNLDKWYCYTLSFWLLHNRGFKAYGIARIPIDKESYLRDYWYTYDYELVTNAGTFPMSQSAYRIPNGWVVDVVNCSVESEWQWNVTSPQLDMGWTGCGTIDKDKTRYFHAVRRKLLYVKDNGQAVFKDTNNSSVDFNSHTTPSEIELQHTITGLGKEPAKIITYDGVAPIPE